MPSDVESMSEAEDASSMTLSSISKEKLYQGYVKMQRRSEKYKSKFSQLIGAYKELEKEREKLKVNLAIKFVFFD